MIRTVNNNEFKEALTNSRGLLVVDFYATWCGPCKMLSPVLEELNNEMEDVQFVKIDVDESRGLSEQYRIKSVPTMMIFKRGKLVDTMTGFVPKNKLKQKLQRHL